MSVRSCVRIIITFCEEDLRVVRMLVGIGSLKLGLFTPGSHIPIVDEDRMFQEQPDYALLLSWHYSEPIIKKLRQKGLRSKIILPLPEVKIIEP